MGLDMYLNKKIYLGWNYEHRRKELGKPLPDLSAYGINSKRITYVIEEIMYWRKANAIHAWFVRNVQGGEDDCKAYPVTRENLVVLHKTVCDVLENPESADELLPTEEGFFFGSTEYDEYYWKDLEETKKELEKIIRESTEYDGFEYHSSW